jgi:hypothetical protein
VLKALKERADAAIPRASLLRQLAVSVVVAALAVIVFLDLLQIKLNQRQ